MLSLNFVNIFRYFFFFFNNTATTKIYTLSLHDALPIYHIPPTRSRTMITLYAFGPNFGLPDPSPFRSEEHTSELQSLRHLVCRLLLEKKKKIRKLCNRIYISC